MEATCARAARIGLPSIAFTEHVDHTAWQATHAEELPESWTRHGVVDGRIVVPAFDTEGYLAEIERCRHLFPELRILTGVELGEPHWHADSVGRLLASGSFTRVLASVHSAVVGEDCVDSSLHYRYVPPAEVELDVSSFEEQFRHVLGAVRDAGKVLEFNTRVPLPDLVLRWWHEVGGEAISFASDAHCPEALASGFREAVALAEATGFRPASDPLDFWTRI